MDRKKTIKQREYLMKKYLVLALTLFFFSCGEPQGITLVLDWAVNTNHTGLFVAHEKGYFQRQGLEVNIQAPPEVGADALVISGSAQFGVSYQEGVTLANANGQDLQAIAAIIQHNTSGLASLASSGIESPADFEGKSYGGWGSPIEEATIKYLMDQSGADFSTVDMKPVGTMNFFGAMDNGIDFAWIFYGWDGVASELNGRGLNYLALKDVDPVFDYYTPVLVATPQYLADNPETAKKFLRAVSEGYAYAMENPEESARILLQQASDLDEELVLASQEFLAQEYQAGAPRWGVMSSERWDRYTAWLLDNGFIESAPESADLFTNAFLPQ
jgi:ABC-type nitrate/sulfonate/bicarbonate transport system substrate-binding protein